MGSPVHVIIYINGTAYCVSVGGGGAQADDLFYNARDCKTLASFNQMFKKFVSFCWDPKYFQAIATLAPPKFQINYSSLKKGDLLPINGKEYHKENAYGGYAWYIVYLNLEFVNESSARLVGKLFEPTPDNHPSFNAKDQNSFSVKELFSKNLKRTKKRESSKSKPPLASTSKKRKLF